MATIAIKKDIFDNLTIIELSALKNLTSPSLGDPVVLTDGEEDWCVFDDSRITEEHILMISYAIGNIAVLGGQSE